MLRAVPRRTASRASATSSAGRLTVTRSVRIRGEYLEKADTLTHRQVSLGPTQVTRGYAKVGPEPPGSARKEAAMDLTYTAAEEEFRRELRSWLQANIPEEWTRPGFWESLDADESFRLRRGRGRGEAGAARTRRARPPPRAG